MYAKKGRIPYRGAPAIKVWTYRSVPAFPAWLSKNNTLGIQIVLSLAPVEKDGLYKHKGGFDYNILNQLRAGDWPDRFAAQ